MIPEPPGIDDPLLVNDPWTMVGPGGRPLGSIERHSQHKKIKFCDFPGCAYKTLDECCGQHCRPGKAQGAPQGESISSPVAEAKAPVRGAVPEAKGATPIHNGWNHLIGESPTGVPASSATGPAETFDIDAKPDSAASWLQADGGFDSYEEQSFKELEAFAALIQAEKEEEARRFILGGSADDESELRARAAQAAMDEELAESRARAAHVAITGGALHRRLVETPAGFSRLPMV